MPKWTFMHPKASRYNFIFSEKPLVILRFNDGLFYTDNEEHAKALIEKSSAVLLGAPVTPEKQDAVDAVANDDILALGGQLDDEGKTIVGTTLDIKPQVKRRVKARAANPVEVDI